MRAQWDAYFPLIPSMFAGWDGSENVRGTIRKLFLLSSSY
jgi:hypothetical protein